MIQAVLSWGHTYAHVVNVRAMMLGVIGRPGAPARPTDLDPTHYLWLVEGIIRDLNEKNGPELDKLYDRADARRAR